MKKKWPEGVIVVATDRYVEEEEYGFYWAWRHAEGEVTRVGKGLNDLFRHSAIYQKVDASTLDSPPPKPEPIEELEDGLYHCLDGDGDPVVMSRSRGQWFDCDGHTREYNNIKTVIGRIPVEPIG